MALPSYVDLMKPLLAYCKDGLEHYMDDAVEYLAEEFKLTDDEKNKEKTSGGETIFHNRVYWARLYLKKAGLVEVPKRGFVQITSLGLKALNSSEKINLAYLKQYPSFNEFKQQITEEIVSISPEKEKTPDELMDEGYAKLRSSLSQELLNAVKSSSPSFFEKLVVDLIVKMGYGGSHKEASKVLGRTGDGGVDGVIKQDALGFEVIYIQAKRWKDASVGGPTIREFIGALENKNAKNGIFITTSDFSRDARDCANNTTKKVILIDGKTLIDYMINYDIGVTKKTSFEIKEMDTDYFQEM